MHEGATKVYILMGKVKGKIELERPNSRWDNKKIEDFKKSDVRSRIQMVQNRRQLRDFVTTAMNTRLEYRLKFS